jgi:hypothetical protein
MNKKSILVPILITTLLFLFTAPIYVYAERDDDDEDKYAYEYEDEDDDDDDAPAVEAVIQTPEVPKIQYVEKIIRSTIVPPIIIHDDNENGIVDEIENLYKR